MQKIIGVISLTVSLGYCVWLVYPKDITANYDGAVWGDDLYSNETFEIIVDGTVSTNLLTFKKTFEGKLEIEGFDLPTSTNGHHAVVEYHAHKENDFYYIYEENGAEKVYNFGFALSEFNDDGFVLFHKEEDLYYGAPATNSAEVRNIMDDILFDR
ncbi:hypothetical protein [Halalkalibacillus sediminis]|nr:hypothetical protein [Halalkalibacillus sediminis]